MKKSERKHSDRILESADKFEARIDDPENTDDPRWLSRIARNLRKNAEKKEKAFEHRQNQKQTKRHKGSAE